MTTGLRRCLYIGLGGSGMNAVLHTKKMFMDNYGEVPPMIGFLGIDTDGGVYSKSLDGKEGSKVSLNASEQVSIVAKGASDIYRQNKDQYFSWLAAENINAIGTMDIGAGQVRSNGRLAFSINYDKVQKSVSSAITQITNATNLDNNKYRLLSNTIEVHLVFSISGGTGAGTFIDAAYLIKSVLPSDGKLIGYGVLPEVFETMIPQGPAMARVKPNAYASLLDLDFLMHLNENQRPIEFKYFTHSETVQKRPFNAIMLIDNKNENNDTYTHIDQLSEMISLSLVTSAGELSVAAASVSDNIDQYIADNTMGIGNKRAWIAGVGACEILFRGDELAKIYALKASQKVIQLLTSGCNDMSTVANQWIDENKLRENDGRDDVIDYLLDQKPKYPLQDITDTLNPHIEVEQYQLSSMPKMQDIESKRTNKIKEVQDTLDKIIIKYLNQECGIDNFENLIIGLQQQVEIFVGEMTEEVSELESKRPLLEVNLKTLNNELVEIASKTFMINKSGKIAQKTEEITSTVYNLVINKRDIIRRQQAIVLYNSLKGILADKYQQCQVILKQIKQIHSDLTYKLNTIQNQVGSGVKTFQIDLAPSISTKLRVDDADININDFIKSLANEEGVYNFDRLTKDEVSNRIYKYALNLPKAKQERDRTIDEVLNSMTNEEFDTLMTRANSKSLPLIQKNYKGHVPETGLYEGFYIGIPNKNKSRFIENGNLKNKVNDAANVEFVPTGMQDRVIFYRQLGVIPTFALDVVQGFKTKYDSCKINCHFDNNVLTRMIREDFGFEPKQESDKTINYWVWGFIFGLIKVENDSYYYQNKKEGQPLTDYWVNMDTKYRDEAFDIFKTHVKDISGDYETIVNTIQKEKGSSEMEKFKNDVKSGSNYLVKYSQVGMTVDELQMRENAKIMKLMNEEVVFIKEEL